MRLQRYNKFSIYANDLRKKYKLFYIYFPSILQSGVLTAPILHPFCTHTEQRFPILPFPSIRCEMHRPICEPRHSLITASLQPAATPSLSAIKKSPVGTSSGPRREIIYKITFYDFLSLIIISTKIMPNPIFCHMSAVTLSSFGLHGGLYVKKVYFFCPNSCIFQKKVLPLHPILNRYHGSYLMHRLWASSLWYSGDRPVATDSWRVRHRSDARTAGVA